VLPRPAAATCVAGSTAAAAAHLPLHLRVPAMHHAPLSLPVLLLLLLLRHHSKGLLSQHAAALHHHHHPSADSNSHLLLLLLLLPQRDDRNGDCAETAH
jgi:hypothetical protein